MPKFQDLTGQSFGRWTAVELMPKEKGKSRSYLCRCSCGSEKLVSANNLRSGKSTSCGCYFREVMEARIDDLTGQKFGRLTVLRRHGKRSADGRVSWACKCDCGKKHVTTGHNLKSGVLSCGCLQREAASEHLTRLRRSAHPKERRKRISSNGTYRSWQSMKKRCTSPDSSDYKDYGAIGIDVCDRWLESFELFLEDMGERPKGKTLDRIDNSKGYHPGNCRWATPKQQARNRRNNRSLTCQGETLLLAEWVERTGIPKSTILNRLCRGKTVEQALGFSK